MKTKIYGTIGPACCDTDMLVRLFEKGMTGMRINLSHSNLKDAAGWLTNIQTARCIAARDQVKPEILMDLRGPELRVGALKTEQVLTKEAVVTLVGEEANYGYDSTEIPVPKLILAQIKCGMEILMDDGKILLKAEETENAIKCRVVREGVLKSGKSIAISDTQIELPTLAKSDWENIAVAKQYGITGVMLPFVRNQKDLKILKEALAEAGAEDIRIFAKIENMEGVRQLPELLKECDEVVIARGDLGNAMPLWELPVVQKQIGDICRRNGKPFMVVTQLLASMEHSAVPTRAEVSDIFRAVEEQAASLMLTGETAVGEYPQEAMMYLINTVREAENRKAKD